MVGHHMAGMTNNSRSRDNAAIPPSVADAERSHAFSAWGGSIWNSTAVGSGFHPTPRDRENSTYHGAAIEALDTKTGIGSLVASSELDGWNPTRWGDTAAAAIPHTRSSGVSPVRKKSVAQMELSPPFGDGISSSFFPVSRPAAVAQAPAPTSSKLRLDPTSTTFTSTRLPDVFAPNAFANYVLGQIDAPQRLETGSWPDGASVHSPNDDRRSVTNSEPFGMASGTPSRSGSLPPSRHGNEPLQLNHNAEPFSRYAQPGQRQHSSFCIPNGRAFQERSGSMQSDSLHLLSRLNMEQEQDPNNMMSHRPSMSGSGHAPSFSPAANETSLACDGLAEARPFRREEVTYGNGNAYTPDAYSNGYVGDPSAQLRAFHFDSHSAPNGTGVRQSPFLSHTHTPPVYDHLYPSRAPESLSNGHNFALMQSKLQGLQLQQERRRYGTPNQFQHQQQLQQLMAANSMRNAYPCQLPAPNALPLHGLPNLAMTSLSTMTPPEPPSAPRYHGGNFHRGTMSIPLLNFKHDSKNNRRTELKDIYGYVVEFSGDQHGSRLIQQKLESANSDEKERIFREVEENSLQLMQDVFGNYVIQKFFEHGDQTQKKMLANRMKGSVAHLALGMYGCRVVQKALEHVLTDQQAWMVKELERDTLKCVKDANGNHVIQKVLERVPVEYIHNVIEAFRGQVGALAVNSFACRVIQRLLEKVPEPQRRFILTELHAEGPKLISDPYGNYVTQHVIEHGLPEDRARIIALVRAQLLVFSKHKFASNVVEKCLLYGTDEQRREIMLTLSEKNERGENSLLSLIMDAFGNYVIQKLMDTLSRADYDDFVVVLKPELEKAKKIISGKQITSVEKKLHRFDHVDNLSDKVLSEATRMPFHVFTSDAVAVQANPLSSPSNSPPLPALTSDAQSPQSSSLPSGNASTVDEPVHTSPSQHKDFTALSGVISIEHAGHAS